MKVKEKAQELVDKFYVWTSRSDSEIHKQYDAKQCALIAVDVILSQEQVMEYHGLQPFIDVEYWKEVKQEIDKL